MTGAPIPYFAMNYISAPMFTPFIPNPSQAYQVSINGAYSKLVSLSDCLFEMQPNT